MYIHNTKIGVVTTLKRKIFKQEEKTCSMKKQELLQKKTKGTCRKLKELAQLERL